LRPEARFRALRLVVSLFCHVGVSSRMANAGL